MLTLFPMPLVLAAGTPTLKVDPQNYVAPVSRANETFNINVSISDVEADMKLVSVQFRLSYNSTLLMVLDVAEGSFLKQFGETFFIYFVEDDEIYGPNIVVGIMLLPNATGQWPGPFPEGNGTLTTITFKSIYQPAEPQPSVSCTLELLDTMLLDSDGIAISHIVQDGYYEVQPLPVPIFAIRPPTYNATKRGEIFDIDVDLNNLDVRWTIIGVQFRLTYESELLMVLDVAEGSFLKQFGETFFIYFVEDDEIYGPNIVVGIMLLPNATGQWPGPFPEGNGTLTTITFEAIDQTTVEPEPPANFTFQILDAMLVNDLGETLLFDLTSGYYQILPLTYPIAEFTYEPLSPSLGEMILFNASESYDPDYEISLYTWDFGDGEVVNTTTPFIGHVYNQQGKFNVTLTVTDIDGLTANTTKSISISYYKELTVIIDVGSLHFKGEIAEFNVLITNFGRPVNATSLEAKLYFSGALLQDLSSSVESVDIGLYRIPYTIPAGAEAGEYTLLVKAEYYGIKGASIKIFQISLTLTNWGLSIAQITEINDGIATITTNLDTIKVNLTSINARLVSIEGMLATIESDIGTLQTNLGSINASLTGLITTSKGEILAQINTAVGTITTRLDAINATITQVNGNTVTISTTLGEVETKLDGIQSTATTTLYAASILSAIAVILAALILMILRKK